MNFASIRPPFRYVALQQLMAPVDMALLHDVNGRCLPGKVYPVAGLTGSWVVEPPEDHAPAIGESKTFTGHAALNQALEYSHRTYGSTVYFSR